MSDQLEKIVNRIFEKIYEQLKKIGYVEIEASGRHVHLSKDVIDALFGKDYKLTKIKELSQPGQFVSKERVTLKGPKGQLQNVVILGPEREKSQIEVSKTDANILGIKAPLKESGKIQGTPGLEIAANGKNLTLDEGVLVADRHIHMSMEDAKNQSFEDGDRVDVEVQTDRPIIFKNVKLRVSENSETAMHIDYDEANACNLSGRMLGLIVKK